MDDAPAPRKSGDILGTRQRGADPSAGRHVTAETAQQFYETFAAVTAFCNAARDRRDDVAVGMSKSQLTRILRDLQGGEDSVIMQAPGSEQEEISRLRSQLRDSEKQLIAANVLNNELRFDLDQPRNTHQSCSTNRGEAERDHHEELARLNQQISDNEQHAKGIRDGLQARLESLETEHRERFNKIQQALPTPVRSRTGDIPGGDRPPPLAISEQANGTENLRGPVIYPEIQPEDLEMSDVTTPATEPMTEPGIEEDELSPLAGMQVSHPHNANLEIFFGVWSGDLHAGVKSKQCVDVENPGGGTTHLECVGMDDVPNDIVQHALSTVDRLYKSKRKFERDHIALMDIARTTEACIQRYLVGTRPAYATKEDGYATCRTCFNGRLLCMRYFEDNDSLVVMPLPSAVRAVSMGDVGYWRYDTAEQSRVVQKRHGTLWRT